MGFPAEFGLVSSKQKVGFWQAYLRITQGAIPGRWERMLIRRTVEEFISGTYIIYL